jgi:hypothetical protein
MDQYAGSIPQLTQTAVTPAYHYQAPSHQQPSNFLAGPPAASGNYHVQRQAITMSDWSELPAGFPAGPPAAPGDYYGQYQADTKQQPTEAILIPKARNGSKRSRALHVSFSTPLIEYRDLWYVLGL